MTSAASALRGAVSRTKPYDESSLDITCFVSCYNEAAYVADTLDTICSAAREVRLRFEIIVIDDCSKDDSREKVREYIAAHPDENILLRANKNNRGLAQNYVDCAFMGRGKYYRLFCGDNAEPRESIVGLLKAVGEADCIVPYRASDGRSGWRHMISAAYTNIINAITGNRVTYYNGSSIHLRYNVMRWHTNTKGFGFQAEILCLLLDLGFTYKEVNIVAQEQRQGKSNALTARNMLSVAHTIIEIANRRISNWVYKSR
jgi:glycosyltransferase involved in cell wall biosynthesis